MPLHDTDGNRVTAATIETTPYVEPNPLVTIDQDLFRVRTTVPGGEVKTLVCRAGERVPESRLAAWFAPASVHSVTPDSGPAVGGNEVTLRGAGLDAVSAVTFDGVAATGLDLISAGELIVTAPAGTVGVVDVVLTDDSGDTTLTGAYTYE